MRLYTVYDSKAEQYSNPIAIRTDGEARRQFSVIATDKNTEIGKHPEDFCLFRIGSFDPETGIITPETGPCIAKAIEFQNHEEN